MAIVLQAAPVTAPPPVNFKVASKWEMEFQLPAEPAKADDDGALTVIARRPYRGQMTTRYDKKTMTRTCRVDRAFGIPPIDTTMCDDILACEAEHKTRRAARDCLLARFEPRLMRHFNLPPAQRSR